MPFDPLPTSLSELCRGVGAGWRGVEMGCGDGALLGRLRRHGALVAGLDLAPPLMARAVQVRGDARRPPLRDGALDLVVAGNLVRHLRVSDPDLGFLDAWLRLLRPGGSVFVLEDEPSAGRAAGNHRDLQAFLARLSPAVRGPLVSRDAFLAALPGRFSDLVREHGLGPNASVQEGAPAVRMLRSGAPAAGSEADRLATAIQEHGLACGRQWWLRLATAAA